MTPVDLGPFRLERLLGRGGMSEVWAARHVRQRVPVAVKLQAAAGGADRAAFAAEVRAVAQLDHPSIIVVFDQGVVDEAAAAASGGALRAGTPWLAMERCGGGSLRAHLPTDWAGLRGPLAAILSALGSAHARGVLHRDLTPDNVLLADPSDLSPGLKLTDFGLAFAREIDDPSVVLGTPAFMAPEQFARAWRDYGPWTDLYALGCLAWFLTTGAAPFGEDRPPEVLALAHQELEPPAFQPRFEVPPGFEELLRRLLAKDPLARPRLAADARRALDALDGAPDGASESPDDADLPSHARAPGPDRRPVRMWGVGLGLYSARVVPMVGRDEEREALWAALGEVYRGGVARLVVVQGGLGFGKSRLVQWLCARAEEVGLATSLEVRHSEEESPGDGLPGALTRRLGCEGLDPDALERRVEHWLRRRGVTDPWEWKALRTLLAPSHATDSGSVAFLTPDQRYAVTRRLVERLAAERPLVLYVEDAQFASDTLSFVEELLTAQDASPSAVLVVLAVRAETLAERGVEQAQVEELLARPDARVIEVGPLGEAHQTQLVEGLLGLSGELGARVRARSGGNPSFAVHLVGDWVAREVLVPTGDGFHLRAGAQADLPDDIHAFWSARLERALDGRPDARAARDVLEIAALLGPSVDGREWGIACRSAGVAPPAGLVERLVRERLLALTPDGWGFAHNMVRESLARGAVEGGRAPRWHAACAHAAALAPSTEGRAERLATHLAGAGDLDAAADFQLLAAQERLARGEDRAALGLLADRDDGLAAAGVPEHDVRWGEGQVLQARLHARQGQWEQAERPAQAAHDGARRHGWSALLPAALTARGEAARGRGDATQALRYLSEARGLCERGGDRRELALVLRSLGSLSAQVGELGRASRLLLQAQTLFRELKDPRAVGDCLVARADVARRAGLYDRVPALLDEAEQIHSRYGNRAGEAEVRLVRADLARARGDLAGAMTGYRDALARHESIGGGQVLGPLAGLGFALVRSGRRDDARSVLEVGRKLAGQEGGGQWLGRLHLLLAAVEAGGPTPWSPEAYDAHIAAARDWLRLTREAHPDLAEAADLAADLLTTRDPGRAREARETGREQRVLLARGITDGA